MMYRMTHFYNWKINLSVLSGGQTVQQQEPCFEIVLKDKFTQNENCMPMESHLYVCPKDRGCVLNTASRFDFNL